MRYPNEIGPDAMELRPLRLSTSHAEIRDNFATTTSLASTSKLGLLWHGCRFSTINYALYVTIVFLCNLTVTAWATHYKSTGDELILDGPCDKIRSWNTWLHLIINILGTILLSGSNYCMQCLSAPTRSEVDQAHAKGVWLDIGVPSTRNLRFIGKRRVIVWAMLGLSSVPLHLFYNSMVYSSIASHDFYIFNVSEAFLRDQDCLNCDKTEDFGAPGRDLIIDLHSKARNNQLVRLEPNDCINEYAVRIQSFKRNVLLVGPDDGFPSRDLNTTSKIFYYNTRVYDYFIASAHLPSEEAPSEEVYNWICEANYKDITLGSCRSSVDGVKDGAPWTVNGFKVDYCLSEIAPSLCKLHILVRVGWLATSLNLIKALLIYYTIFIIKDGPILTMGDAVASFIQRPDPRTKGLCLSTVKHLKQHSYQTTPQPWRVKTDRWKDATSKTRRATALTMCVIVLITVSVLLNRGVKQVKGYKESTSLQSLTKIGFGAIDPRTIIQWNVDTTMGNIFIANIAQLILSLVYFFYNALFTCMLLGFEWSQYAHERKGLRVSSNQSGAQRSTYFLQLPYRYSLPLVVLSGLLHWLVSQSIFLVAIDYYKQNGEPYRGSYGKLMTCGYSPIAIVSVLVLGTLLVIAGIGFGYIPYKPGMTLAGSCSLAMSAACHSEEWDLANGQDAARSKLQWGVVGVGEDGVGHCAFSMREVEFPEKGKMYA